jgi:hypothetical protein
LFLARFKERIENKNRGERFEKTLSLVKKGAPLRLQTRRVWLLKRLGSLKKKKSQVLWIIGKMPQGSSGIGQTDYCRKHSVKAVTHLRRGLFSALLT